MDTLINSSVTISSISTNSPAESGPETEPPANHYARPLDRELELLRERLGAAPLALALFRMPDNALQSRGLLAAIQEHMLSCDSLGWLDEGRYALVLHGAGVFKAQALVERILQAVPNLAQAVGIACCTGDAASTAILPQQAYQALQDALNAGVAVRVYRAPAHPLSERKTLVHSNEKRFLFSGGE